MVRVTGSAKGCGVPYVQIPPAASPPRSFGTREIPPLASCEARWPPGSSYRGFLKLPDDETGRTLSLKVRKVAVGGGAVSSAEDRKANGTALGGTFHDIPVGASHP